jgi:anaerobic ribonucleoside-triphosphate reductase activating protein
VSLQVAYSVPCTEAEGPFRRHALWLQGCTLACPGCCNPELFPATGGVRRPVASVIDELAASLATHAIEGVSVLGGEPSEQLLEVTELCVAARALGLGVLLFSGRTLAELRALPGGAALLAAIDTLVDGRFEAALRDDSRRFVGSSNQRIVHLTPRYADPALWRGPAGVELQLGPDGALSLHGAPALARRLTRALRASASAAGPSVCS